MIESERNREKRELGGEMEKTIKDGNRDTDRGREVKREREEEEDANKKKGERKR